MENIKKQIKNENIINMLILLIATIFICLPLLNKNLDMSYDDGIQHIARLMGTEQSISEGQKFPVIMSNFCNGFGYSWNIFYSPFTAFVPLIFRLFGESFITCIKLFMFVMVFTSGVSMYFFTKEVTKNKKIAVLAGVFYIFAPYRFTDMYARNALAELTTFAFLPMVFNGLYGVLKEKPKKEYLLILGSVFLLLTHTVITMYVAIICFIYTLTQSKKLLNKKIRNKIIFSLIFIMTITSFFWVPLLEHKFGANYEVFKPGRMERPEVLIFFKLHLSELFITPKENIMTYEIGWLSIILLLLTPIVIKKIKKKRKKTDFYRFYNFSLIAGLTCTIMTLKIFPFEHLPAILKMLQFSFRLLEFSSFFFAFVCAVNAYILIEKIKNIEGNKLTRGIQYADITVIVAILMALSSTFIPHLRYVENLDENKIWPAVPVTSSTGRVHAGCASFEYLPCNAFENRSYIETRENKVLVLEGNGEINEEQKNGTNLEFKISSEEKTTIELPYIYYLGYNVMLEQNGTITNIETFETENGFIGIRLSPTQNGIIKVSYTGTMLMKIFRVVSILGIVTLVFLYIKSLKLIY